MMPKLTGIVLVVAMLAACQQEPVRDESSQYSRIPTGSRIVLHQVLVVPEGAARVFLQAGKVITKARLNQYFPHCDFEVREVSDGSQRIKPASFIVTRVTEGEAMVVRRETGLRHVGLNTDGSSSMISRFVRYRLSAEGQPSVMRLNCHGGFDDPPVADYPSVRDIRHVLGKVASIVPGKQGGR